ncbi:Acyl-CoA-binding domain-containing protein 4 [Acorus calamus]|uniref:Acyl-CoA-binding domain-containing protein 4 n=1 Tax=Acorus calamus TaxID=4465 RepID=A0AAV9CML7_ACOCL|nr:Acyl-CoA-binding domain-containing protein 4 [Acorus calamus]
MTMESVEIASSDSDITTVLSGVPFDQWVQLPVSGFRPSARYKHAAEVADGKLYVAGGSRNGRYLSDFQVFDFGTLSWSTLSPKFDFVGEGSSEEVFRPCSGHSMVKWGSKLLIVAGHVKGSSDSVTVWSIDIETNQCNIVKTYGKVPIARGGQSVTLVGSRLVMFGGEDTRKRLLNDLHILDLETMLWDSLETTQNGPTPRSDHTAALHADRYLMIFGGSSHSICFNDLHILDLQTMEWSQPQIQFDIVTPRSGHAGAIADDNWYIVGGGDNTSAASETIVLNMSKLVWSIATSMKERHPLASEGLTLCTALIGGEDILVSFGGYNGRYNNEVFVLKPKPRSTTRPRIVQSPAAAAAAASVTAAYALTTTGEKKVLTNSVEGSKESQTESSPQVSRADTDAFTMEKETLESRLAEVKQENFRLERDLDEMNNTHMDLLKELQSVQGQLTAETLRCFKLEMQITDTKKKLESLHSIENEIQVLRQQMSISEQDKEFGSDSSKRQSSGGVWQWIAGTPQQQ